MDGPAAAEQGRAAGGFLRGRPRRLDRARPAAGEEGARPADTEEGWPAAGWIVLCRPWRGDCTRAAAAEIMRVAAGWRTKDGYDGGQTRTAGRYWDRTRPAAAEDERPAVAGLVHSRPRPQRKMDGWPLLGSHAANKLSLHIVNAGIGNMQGMGYKVFCN